MTQPAPYTPATIRRIRDLAARKVIPSAIATDLGWDLERLARVARDHSIDIAVAIPKPKDEGDA